MNDHTLSISHLNQAQLSDLLTVRQKRMPRRRKASPMPKNTKPHGFVSNHGVVVRGDSGQMQELALQFASITPLHLLGEDPVHHVTAWLIAGHQFL